MAIIQHAVLLHHRFPLGYRDVQELLHQRGIEVSDEILREWCIKFAPLFVEGLRHLESRRGSRWHLDEVWILSVNSNRQQRTRHFEGPQNSHARRNTADFEFTDSIRCVLCMPVGGVRHWLLRAVDESGVVLVALLQHHRDTETARMFLARLLGELHVPETICTDKLASYGAAIRELPVLQEVDHQQVIKAARCNNLVE